MDILMFNMQRNQMEKFDKLRNIVYNLIELNFENQKLVTMQRSGMGAIQYAQEICTVNVFAGRQTGHTTIIKSIAKSYFGSNECIVVAHTYESIRQQFSDIKVRTYSAKQILNGNLRGHTRPRLILVDEPRYCFRNSQDKYDFYNQIVSPHMQQCFVLLGNQ
jgi:hypothetical protein